MKRYLNVLLSILLTSLILFNCAAPFDAEPPKIEIISPKEGVTYYTAIPIELKVADDRTVNRVEVFLDNQLVETFTRGPFVTKLDISAFEETNDGESSGSCPKEHGRGNFL
jgi:hypothetical protein